MATTKQAPSSKSIAAKLPPEKLKEMFRQMLLARRFEERTGQQYQMKKFSGFCHLYIGQEAAAVGAVHAIEQGKDYIFTTYRDHAHALLMGISAREVMAELFMRVTGCSRGKGGSMHMYNAKNRYFGGNGIVGGHTPLATGAAFASKYRNEGAVALCFMGDAAVNQGTFHESLNMAGLWKLPVVYIVENNVYGMGTAVSRSCAQTEFYKRTGDAYKIPGVQVNAMDVLDVYEKTKDAVEKARNGQPMFLEYLCYRYRGHSMSDPATAYRTKDEVSDWQTRDPLENLRAAAPDVITEAFVAEMEAEVKAEVDDAIKFAEESPYPELSDVWTDVYIDCPGYPKPEEAPKNKYEFPYEQWDGKGKG